MKLYKHLSIQMIFYCTLNMYYEAESLSVNNSEPPESALEVYMVAEEGSGWIREDEQHG